MINDQSFSASLNCLLKAKHTINVLKTKKSDYLHLHCTTNISRFTGIYAEQILPIYMYFLKMSTIMSIVKYVSHSTAN